MKKVFFFLGFIMVGLVGSAQDLLFDIHTTNAMPVHKKDLNTARTLSDINPGYPASWISDYVSAELTTTCLGKVTKAESPNDILSPEQQKILKLADLGTDIQIVVKYNDKNSITGISYVAAMNFKMTLSPDIDAQYPGGKEVMSQYLKNQVIDNISEPITKLLQQAMVRFTVNEQGMIADARITTSSKDADTDHLILEAINNMPAWTPAVNADGSKVSQQFEFRVWNSGTGC